MNNYDKDKVKSALKDLLSINDVDINDIKLWRELNPKANKMINQFTDEQIVSEKIELMNSIIDAKSDNRKRFLSSYAKLNRRNRRNSRIRTILYSGAAAVAVLLITALIFVRNDSIKPIKDTIVAENSVYTTTELSNEILLIRSDGVELVLNNKETIEIDKNINVANNTINYSENINNDSTVIEEKVVRYNQLITPAGATYKVRLSDGSEITLNANSSIYYPDYFPEDKNREVFLTGEAYFSVAKSETPFIVNSGKDVQIKVYGTEFNINCYDTTKVDAILVRGSIGLKSKQLSKEVIMTPNDRVIYNLPDNSLVKNIVEPSRYIAWLNNLYDFRNNSLEEVFGMISNYSGIQFSYDGCRDDVRITGIFNRGESIEEILSAISLSADIKYFKKGGVYVIE